ncbi:hypothetical protein FLL45_01460 [Aliikangiella marina]|uniref:DUF4406 domain-containing protein n=1 Tax=Aliikangiella marina TaxID=1712262 RepID=A0A545THE5_9GAMM|nr:hypothetical protein [Aliikangiella marina]TQV76654.1 hypothetical protein FLL45_01460 [Aliikangiella marina]
MITVCILGPYASESVYERDLNVEAVRYIGLKVARLGLVPVMPTVETHRFDHAQDKAFFVDAAKEKIRRSSAVYLVDGSEYSLNTMRLAEYAKEMNIPIFHSLECLRINYNLDPIGV